MEFASTAAAANRPAYYYRELNVCEELIVAWIAMGCSRKRIADNLHRSLKSVEWHMTNIKGKLGFNDPARLTHFALSNNLVQLNEIV